MMKYFLNASIGLHTILALLVGSFFHYLTHGENGEHWIILLFAVLVLGGCLFEGRSLFKNGDANLFEYIGSRQNRVARHGVTNENFKPRLVIHYEDTDNLRFTVYRHSKQGVSRRYSLSFVIPVSQIVNHKRGWRYGLLHEIKIIRRLANERFALQNEIFKSLKQDYK